MRFRIHKRKLLEALLAAALGFAVPASAQADEIARLCGAPVIPSPEFERGTLIDQTAGDIASGHEQVAFNRIADAYERSLRPGEKARLRQTISSGSCEHRHHAGRHCGNQQ